MLDIHAADMSRRQAQKSQHINKKLIFFIHIWNHHEKISTNMPGIGSLIRRIHVKISKI